MRIVLLIIVSIFCHTLRAQKAELVDTGTILRPLRKELFDFQYINNSESIDKLIYVGKMRVYGKGEKSRIRNLYFSILNQVQSIGGNCFRLNNYERIEATKEAVLELDIYHADREFLNFNSTRGDRYSYYIFPASSEIVDTLFIDKIKVPFSVENPFSGTLEKEQLIKIQIWRTLPVINSMVLDETEFKKDRFFVIRSPAKRKSGNVPIGPLGTFIYMDLENSHRIFEEIDQGLANLIIELWNSSIPNHQSNVE